MKEFVLDCSAALPWAFASEATHATAALAADLAGGGKAWVPALWHLEIANTMMGALRRGRIDRAGMELFLGTMQSMAIEVDGQTMGFAWTRTLALGETYRLTAYDAAYLELALRRGLPLATTDRELRAACAKAGVKVLL